MYIYVYLHLYIYIFSPSCGVSVIHELRSPLSYLRSNLKQLTSANVHAEQASAANVGGP